MGAVKLLLLAALAASSASGWSPSAKDTGGPPSRAFVDETPRLDRILRPDAPPQAVRAGQVSRGGPVARPGRHAGGDAGGSPLGAPQNTPGLCGSVPDFAGLRPGAGANGRGFLRPGGAEETVRTARRDVEFQKCLDSTEPVEWNVVKSVIEAELGPISKNFASVDKTPLASASIAQVHAATLKSGEEVVLKIQKPRIDELLKADLNFIYIASRVLEFLQPDFERTSLSAVAGDVKSSMLDELDFKKEATNIEEFRAFLVEQGLDYSVTAPRVYDSLTTKRVLTMERLRGVSMVDAESISTITNDPETLIITALNTWTSSVMNMPWFHADVHSGNLLVLEDGRVGFIDFGMVGRVGEKTFKAVNELSTSLALGDYEGMAQALCNMGATDDAVDVKKFARDIEEVMTGMMSVQPDELAVGVDSDGSVQASISFDEEEVTGMLLKIVAVTEDNGLRLPREFGLLVKQSLYFDRYLKILAPGLDVASDARMIAAQSAANEETGGKVEVKTANDLNRLDFDKSNPGRVKPLATNLKVYMESCWTYCLVDNITLSITVVDARELACSRHISLQKSE
ncbi:hypothetical protein THAOC_36963 [Thalassiosira oceanica]|uniref:ABC1 atypical kinase-like domain-containing protein n=1 Tax=Thalassiosira oceanica TaxID=159749 RepID=K0RD65_THAOC|nr:hypothetical protein THAOC_36963 [Thalassiosira oceanica]|eukprot:EJK44492.1 hypothetical protein THAOC_36963 [Thalassiosira oceanica]